ncbi:MAG: DUF1289 domain-containing protein [Gammaproteobacteria bacterium]|nr:DUF1289 domain-containing protein [Gammaproteobacteria bacterium]
MVVPYPAKDSDVASPCVRNCCLDTDDICLGCFRTVTEIMQWGGASADERREILARCRLRATARHGGAGIASISED